MAPEHSQPSSKIISDDLNTLWDAGTTAKVDIVFVHGLRGHPQSTWEGAYPSHPDMKVYWPQELLPTTVKESRIFSFGYKTDFVTFYPIVTPDTIAHTSIDDNSTLLMEKLGNQRRETSTASRPIIFVAHSLGGLVTANALSSHVGSNDQRQAVVNSTCGTIFLGTPFKGSEKASWAIMAEKFFSLFDKDTNNQTIKDLDKDSKKLQRISEEFHMLLQQRLNSRELNKIQVACFWESESTSIMYSGLGGKKMKNIGQIVTKESATLIGHQPIALNADHRNMCRYVDADSTGYKAITDAIKGFIWNLENKGDDLKKGGTIFNIGEAHNGDSIGNQGIIQGNVVGTVRDAIHQTVSNTSFHGDGASEREAALKAWFEKKNGQS